MSYFALQLSLSLLFVSASLAQISSTAVGTQAVVTTVVVPTTSISLSTYFITVASTSVLDDVSTYTTTVSGIAVTTSTDLGSNQKSVVSITETVVTATPVTGYGTLTSTIGSTTIFEPTSNAVTVATSTPTTSVAIQASTSSPSLSTNTNTGSASPTPVIIISTSKASMVSSIIGSSNSFTATPSATGKNSQRASSHMSAGAKVGIAISAVIGGLAVFIVTFWLGRVWSRRKALAARIAADRLPAEDVDLGGFFSPVVSEHSERSWNRPAKAKTSLHEFTTAEVKGSSSDASEDSDSRTANIAELSAQRLSVQSLHEKGDDEPRLARLSRVLGGKGSHVAEGSVTALPQWNEKS